MERCARVLGGGVNPKFAIEVARYEQMPPEHLAGLIREFQRMLKTQQSMLAAALRAQKNQKRRKG